MHSTPAFLTGSCPLRSQPAEMVRQVIEEEVEALQKQLGTEK